MVRKAARPIGPRILPSPGLRENAFQRPCIEVAQIEEMARPARLHFALFDCRSHAHTAFLSVSKLAQAADSADIASAICASPIFRGGNNRTTFSVAPIASSPLSRNFAINGP